MSRHTICNYGSMKRLMLLIISASFFFACGNKKETGAEKESEKKSKKVSKRDLSITPANSYSDLFFDSAQLITYFREKGVSDSLTRRMISFYNARNYSFAWFSSDGFTEPARGFWNLHDYERTYGSDTSLRDKSLEKTMDNLMTQESFSVNASDKKFLETELTLTRHFIQYALHNIPDGYIKRKEMERFVPRKKEDVMYLADSLLTKKHKDDKYYEDVNEPYRKLKEKLKIYFDIAKAGGWQEIPGKAADYKPGATGAGVLALKRRLFLTGDMPAADTTPVYTEALASAIGNFQVRYGLSPTGKLTDALLKELNVPAVDRVKQIMLNMGRMQWLIHQPEGKLIMVNIPEFKLHVMEGKNKVFDMDVVVGKDGHNTVIFTGNLNQVVFSPYWNVPPSIVKKEILPAIEKNPNYLASQNMEITGNEGALPSIRQLPGAGNSLGKVKFLFPNSFNIYFHDTPAKSLFGKDKRAFSHGCIRLAEPEKFANYLLKDDSDWNAERIRTAMDAGTERTVKLKKSVPVLITYYTAWVDDAGMLHFAEDIYNHDKPVLEKMFY